MFPIQWLEVMLQLLTIVPSLSRQGGVREDASRSSRRYGFGTYTTKGFVTRGNPFEKISLRWFCSTEELSRTPTTK
jgi:hypothetical protein